MIYSMTAFARFEQTLENGLYICELRSMNHRYVEMSLHLPDSLRVFEMAIRERIRQFVKRGKLECTIRYQPYTTSNEISVSINAPLAQALCVACENISSFIANPAKINPIDILQFPGVLEKSDVNNELLQHAVLALLDHTLNELVNTRQREGEALSRLFLEKATAIYNELDKVKNQLPKLMTEVTERLSKRFAEAKLTLDPARLEQEMVMFTHKVDIAEEIDRIEMHLTEVKRVLAGKEGSVGRRLDFLMQELNREANTLGSKSVDAVITHAAVEIKVLIEQMREQIQNVE
jgi:uncharacterized protein (TIGR00255 family)